MSCQQVPTAPAFNPYPRSVQVGEFEVAIGGGIWVAIGDQRSTQTTPAPVLALRTVTYCTENEETPSIVLRKQGVFTRRPVKVPAQRRCVGISRKQSMRCCLAGAVDATRTERAGSTAE